MVGLVPPSLLGSASRRCYGINHAHRESARSSVKGSKSVKEISRRLSRHRACACRQWGVLSVYRLIATIEIPVSFDRDLRVVAVATNRPSGLKATAQTPLLCPGRRTPRQLPQDPSLHSFRQNSIRHVGQCSSRPSALSNRHRTYTRTTSSTPHQAPPNPTQVEQWNYTISPNL
jgi:hypothetical protein